MKSIFFICLPPDIYFGLTSQPPVLKSVEKGGRRLYNEYISACQKSPYRTFLPALSAEHSERVQNAVAESLDISRLSTAVYPI